MQNFNFHQHTYRCGHADQVIQDEEYVQEYIKMGFEKIAFTDHCPEKDLIDIRPNMRMSYSQRLEYLESINSLKEKYKKEIEILTGYEIEYLPGQEENLKELKEETDILILGQHFIYDTDGRSLKIINNHKILFNETDFNKYADYIEAASRKGIPDIIAHPDLFMKATNGFGKIEEKITRRICETSIKYGIPLEINLNDIFRQIYLDKDNNRISGLSMENKFDKLNKVDYPNKDFWKIVSEYNVKVLYGLDTHFGNQSPLYKELVNLATKIIGQDVIDKLNFIEEW